MPGNLRVLMRPSAVENLIKFCRRESFKTYRVKEVQENNLKMPTIKQWVKVKVSRKRPGLAQRFPGGLGSQISMTFGT